MAVEISIDGSKINLTDTGDVDADGKADAIEESIMIDGGIIE